MNSDRIASALVSLAIISGGTWLGEMAHRRGPLSPAIEPATAATLLVMPWIEPDQSEPVRQDTDRQPVDLRPPMMPDVPALPNPNAFVQPLEPPPPDAYAPKDRMVTIPVDPGAMDRGGRIFDPSQLDRQPVALFQAKPSYPFEMRRSGISGQVTVDFIVEASGHVRGAFAAQSTNREFESAAVAAVSKWKFQPGRKSGLAVSTHMQVPIVFTLNGDGGSY